MFFNYKWTQQTNAVFQVHLPNRFTVDESGQAEPSNISWERYHFVLCQKQHSHRHYWRYGMWQEYPSSAISDICWLGSHRLHTAAPFIDDQPQWARFEGNVLRRNRRCDWFASIWSVDRISNPIRKQRSREQVKIRHRGRVNQANPIRSLVSTVFHGDYGRSARTTHHNWRFTRNDQADRVETPRFSRGDHVCDDGSAAVHRVLSETGRWNGESTVSERNSSTWTNVSRNKFVMFLTESM